MELTSEQKNVVRLMHKSPGGFLNASEMGTGKTAVTAQYLIEAGVKTVLIICPLGTRVGWERELRKMGWEYSVKRIDSTDDGKAAFQELANKIPGAYLIGREYFTLSGSSTKKPKNAPPTWQPSRVALYDWSKIIPDVTVYDEIHAVQNRQGIGFKILSAHQPPFRIGLSGTPSGNRFKGLWAVCRWLWPDVIDRSFWRWAAKWAKVEFDPWAGRKVGVEKVPGKFVKSLPGYARIEAKLGEIITEQRLVELSPAQRKVYDQLEDDLVAWLEDDPLVVEVPMTMRIRLRQITLGMPSFDDDGQVVFSPNCKSSKIDALKELLDDLGDTPVVIFTESQKFAEVVVHRLGKKAVEWSGRVSSSAREKILETFGKPGGAQYLVATIKSIGEGVDGLQHVSNHMVWLSRDDNAILNEQAAMRLNRIGQTKPVYSFEILAADTYDEGVLRKTTQQLLDMNKTLREEQPVA